MYSTAHNFLYLHVPKTAGNAIQRALLPFSDDAMVLRDGQDGVDRFGISGPLTPTKHAHLTDYEALSPGIAESAKVIISVRHPFERAVSAFFHTYGASATFTETAFWRVLKSPIFGPMVDFLRLNDRLHVPAHIIRYETLAVDFQSVVRALRLSPDTRLSHVNMSLASPEQHRRLLEDPVLRDAVETYYRDDMHRFGYESYRI